MKKNSKKICISFAIAFIATLLIGGLALGVYSKYSLKMASENTEVLQVIETDAEIEGDEQATQNEVQNEQEEQIKQESESEGDSKVLANDAEIEGEVEKEIEEMPGESGSVTLTFGGDICFHDPFANMGALVSRGGTMETCIDRDLLMEMRESDICMVNNEFPYSDRGAPIPEKTFAFRSKPENVKLLHEMGVDIVSLANNHAYDHGEEALLDTLSVLENADVKYVGAGRNLEEASQAVFFDANQVRVAILSATQIERMENPDTRGATENSPGVLRCFSEKELNHFLTVVENVKKRCDVLVVYMHWGTENTDELDWAQPYQAQLIANAGADIIVGAHPHCLQGIDQVSGVPVIYSLGNYWFNSKAMDTALLKVKVNGEGIESVQIIPARQENCSTSMLHEEEAQRVLGYLQGISSNVMIDRDGYVTW